MKKMIAMISVATMMGCAFALANTDDTMSNTSNTDTTRQQEAGTMGNDSNMQNTDTPHTNTDTSATSTTTTTKSAMNKKSCTDDNGKVLNHGQKGFTACMKNLKRQQSGVADPSSMSGASDDSAVTSETHKITHNNDMNSNDTSGNN
jgi:hypothetical protein